MLFRYDDFSKCQKNETIVPRKLFKILFQLFNIFQATCFLHNFLYHTVGLGPNFEKVPFVNLHYGFNSISKINLPPLLEKGDYLYFVGVVVTGVYHFQAFPAIGESIILYEEKQNSSLSSPTEPKWSLACLVIIGVILMPYDLN